MLFARFICRADAYAVQLDNGSYRAVKDPLTREYVEKHIRGEITIATYPLDHKDRAKFGAIDLDAPTNEEAEEARDSFREYLGRFSRLAAQNGLNVLNEHSGRRGFHSYILVEEMMPAKTIRSAVGGLVNQAGEPDPPIVIEIFPKQDAVGPDGLGNPLKLPWGRHRCGTRAQFVKDALTPDGDWIDGQLQTLERAAVHSSELIAELADKYGETDGGPEDQCEAAPQPSDVVISSEVSSRVIRILTVLRTDSQTVDLFRGVPDAPRRYASRSEKEFALASRLFHHGLSVEEARLVLTSSAIGRFSEATKDYQDRTLIKAREWTAKHLGINDLMGSRASDGERKQP
jgi:hypothetical protein